VPLSSYFNDYNGSGKPYDGEIRISRHKDMQESKIHNLSRHAVDLLGHKYDSVEIIRIASRLATSRLFKWKGDQLKENDVYICSEYVYECFKSIGIMINHSCGFVIPKDFADDPNVEVIF